ncbi:MAG: 6-phosphogluconolactonase, partial [Oscillibacter sp.]|nr:6-phosphogluconolactonase [Oscillibacter sp.]
MHHVKIIRCADPAEVGKRAADMYTALLQEKPACLLGLATGSTPLPLYRELVKRCESGEMDFSRVRSVNLDEYKGLSGDHPQSYRYFMNENLFRHISIDPANTMVPDGLAEDVEAMCAAY